MALYHGVALPMAEKAPIINFIRAVLESDSVEDLAQPGALSVFRVPNMVFGLTKVPSKVSTPCLVFQIKEYIH